MAIHVVFLNSESAISMKEKSEKNFPAWCLLVSGGHSQILEVDSKLRIKKIAETSDDAAGECFDKSAKLMGLSYPGGPAIEQLAQKLLPKDKSRALELEAALPVPRSEKGFSFSGLKTAIRLKLEKDESLAKDPAFAWAIEKRIGETLMKTFERCFESHQPNISQLIFCGGVSANKSLRARMENFCTKESLELSLPSLKFCTDNAAMVAACAFLQDPSLKLTDVNAQIAL
jgi:N6-L-threonylcarbamoyladenine synthase